MKAREVGRTVEIIARIVAATMIVFVVGDASSRDGRWSVGGEVDWQGLRRHVGGQRAASSARLSVGLGSVQVDVFVGCHCCGYFGSCAAILSTYRYYCTYLHVPTWVVSTILFPSSAIHFPQKRCHNDDLSHEIRLRLLSACGSGDAVDVAARAPRITSKMERRDSIVAVSSSKKDPAPPLAAPSSLARATIKVRVLDHPNPRDDGLPYLDRLEVCGGDGPVDALANALKKALAPSHPVESQ